MSEYQSDVEQPLSSNSPTKHDHEEDNPRMHMMVEQQQPRHNPHLISSPRSLKSSMLASLLLLAVFLVPSLVTNQMADTVFYHETAARGLQQEESSSSSSSSSSNSNIETGNVKAILKNNNNKDRCDAQFFHSLCVGGYHHSECQCQATRNLPDGDPMHNTVGNPKIGDRWQAAFSQQRARVANLTQTINVVFVGDSITEHWLGEALGEADEKYQGIHQIFQRLFTRKDEQQDEDDNVGIQGLVLAISGERTWNVMYRLKHDAFGDKLVEEDEEIEDLLDTHRGDVEEEEDDGDTMDEDAAPAKIPSNINTERIPLNPKVIWLTIGTNDATGDCCSSTSIAENNIALVEELQRLRPHATIVINGILPKNVGYQSVIVPANEQLKDFADRTENVEYFDASSVFLNPQDDPQNAKPIHLSDGLHPDEEGHRLWGEAIHGRLLELLSLSS